MERQPSSRQRGFLENRGIVAPPTFAACNRLIGFIKCGNGTIGDNEASRIAITKSYEQRWIGKRVQYRSKSPWQSAKDEGTVGYLVAYDPFHDGDLIRDARRHYGQDATLHPFQIFVRWEQGRPSITCIRLLELAEAKAEAAH